MKSCLIITFTKSYQQQMYACDKKQKARTLNPDSCKQTKWGEQRLEGNGNPVIQDLKQCPESPTPGRGGVWCSMSSRRVLCQTKPPEEGGSEPWCHSWLSVGCFGCYHPWRRQQLLGVLRGCLGNCVASHLLLKILEGRVERNDLNSDEIQVKAGVYVEENWRFLSF